MQFNVGNTKSATSESTVPLGVQLHEKMCEQFISHQIPVELSSKFATSSGGSGEVVVGSEEGIPPPGTGRVDFQTIPESESMSPITDLSPHMHKGYM